MPQADVLVIGGGIAGLWILDRLVAAGYSAVLIERQALGAGQTIAAQGIIHGGTKYAVEPRGRRAAATLSGMPALWRDLMKGKGEPDLGAARLCAERHLLVTGGIGMEIATRLVSGSGRRLLERDWPQILKDAPGKRRIVALDEPVVDVGSVLATLAARHAGRIRRAEALAVTRDDDGVTVMLRGPRGRPGQVKTRLVIAAAGAGNGHLLADARQQTRPLHMVMARGAPAALHAHWISGAGRPRLTVTTHAHDGGLVWYCGGDLAERGVEQSPGDLIDKARRELERAVGKDAIAGLRFATVRIDRAEGAARGGRRPDGPVLQPLGRVLAVWPTKMALAPALARTVADWVAATLPLRTPGEPPLGDWPRVDLAATPWAEVERWS